MNNVFFRPWVGNRYGKVDSVFSKKILILGDSHYTDESEVTELLANKQQSSDFTTGVMNDYLSEDVKGNWKSTFTKFMNSFVQGTSHEEFSREELWGSVAFYNYLQIPAGTKPRLTQHYDYTKETDRKAFLEVIGELEPDVIISWGNKAWDAMPEDFGFGNYVANKKFSDFYHTYPFKENRLKVLGINHPSSAYKSSYWSGVFTETQINA
ncbi:hypothetical protein [Psychrosphaera algicola]|uniref:Uracil DNA glycosylase superfamily protein n=1 Tax=Psychrosphaera algicola TaxID=3023714 RepID=A0ABT5FIL6_9GAMM|nr:hypothetical protein [Psychrosphaera sp. G1-22]MDC2891026.1 hypothetical protein [Psychrosphaera sp. G1-22]